jgi:hypothetical protein
MSKRREERRAEMSAVCCCCKGKVRKPDTLWFAGTRYSPTVNWICGTCLDTVPEHERIEAADAGDFEICFGRVMAETNDCGIYQCSGSKQGKAEFSVDWEVLRNCLPGGEFFLNELYPYYCLDTYVEIVMKRREYIEIPTDREKYQYLVWALCHTGNTLRSALDLTIQTDGKTTTQTMPLPSIPANLCAERAREILDLLDCMEMVEIPCRQ